MSDAANLDDVESDTRAAFETYSAAKNTGDVEAAMARCDPDFLYRNA